MTAGFLFFFKKPSIVSPTGALDPELLRISTQGEPRYGLTMRIAGVVVADDYAPERVLSPVAMAEAHEMLGSLFPPDVDPWSNDW
ncbi:MAG TPA: hypothetical protein PK156_35865 [Polyangium sp.]|nr:hypothetical protein [Polyangium sp.]